MYEGGFDEFMWSRRHCGGAPPSIGSLVLFERFLRQREGDSRFSAVDTHVQYLMNGHEYTLSANGGVLRYSATDCDYTVSYSMMTKTITVRTGGKATRRSLRHNNVWLNNHTVHHMPRAPANA